MILTVETQYTQISRLLQFTTKQRYRGLLLKDKQSIIYKYGVGNLLALNSIHNSLLLTQSIVFLMDGSKKCFTFAGGPTQAPDFLKQSLSQALFSNNSLLNINSNDKECKEMQQKTKSNLVQLLHVPNDYQVWFCSGGVHLQFAAIALNYAGNKEKEVVANYTTTGWFSKLAYNEGKKFLTAHNIAEMEKDQYGRFRLPKQYDYAPNAAYTHFVDNETVEGLEYPDNQFPYQPGVPLLDDCSSSILTKPIDWTKVTMAYAHSQKNCGISGVTVLIIKDSFLNTNPCPSIPEICDYRIYKQRGGFPEIYNSTGIYAMMKMSEHMLQQGGIKADHYRKRANLMYSVLDSHPAVFLPKVCKQYRSRINVTWECRTPELADKCIQEGIEHGLYQFKGHRTVGGFRASLFNPVPDEAVERLSEFLDEFGKKYEQ